MNLIEIYDTVFGTETTDSETKVYLGLASFRDEYAAELKDYKEKGLDNLSDDDLRKVEDLQDIVSKIDASLKMKEKEHQEETKFSDDLNAVFDEVLNDDTRTKKESKGFTL